MKRYISIIKKLFKAFIIKQKYTSSHRDKSIWLFGEWFGERCCDNSMYLANYIADNHPEIKVYWAFKNRVKSDVLSNKINKLNFDTKDAIKIYMKAGVTIMNQGFLDFSVEGFNYFAGAINLNLWHGVMWKRIGNDGLFIKSTAQQLYHQLFYKLREGMTNYLTLSDEYTKNCLTAWGAKPEQFIKAGYPRNSIFYHPECLRKAKQHIIDLLQRQTGIAWNFNTKIITYMPTFRDNASNTFSIEELSSNKEFMKWLEENNIIIIQKAHFVTSKWRHELESMGKEKRIFSLNDAPAQELLAATDLLITDYSSCFFDFLLLDRPIIHYLYDYDYYANHDRGLYYKKEEVVCGDSCENKEQLVNLIMQNMEHPQKNHELREKRREKFMTYESPDSCEIIYKEIQKRLEKMK